MSWCSVVVRITKVDTLIGGIDFDPIHSQGLSSIGKIERRVLGYRRLLSHSLALHTPSRTLSTLSPHSHTLTTHSWTSQGG